MSSPLFVVVYGLSEHELPEDEMITIQVPGLTIGSDQDVYSVGVGFLTFVVSKHQDDMGVVDNDSNANDSKES